MQWQYQVRPSGLLDGMALTLAEKALRALQDTFSIHKTILATDATISTCLRICSTSYYTRRQEYGNMVEVLAGGGSLAGMASVVHTTILAFSFLVQRWRLVIETLDIGHSSKFHSNTSLCDGSRAVFEHSGERYISRGTLQQQSNNICFGRRHYGQALGFSDAFLSNTKYQQNRSSRGWSIQGALLWLWHSGGSCARGATHQFKCITIPQGFF